MAIVKKKISELKESSSLSGLYTVGTQETKGEDEFGQPVIRQESVKIGLEFIKESTEEATDAADNANSAAQTAAQAAENATDAAAAASAAAEEANNATAAATEATENANTQAEYAKAQGDYALEQAIANKSGILLDTTLSPDEVNAKMTEILQAFLINPAVLITIKADIETEGQPEYKWFNYAVTDYSDNGETQTLTLLSETTTDNNRLSVKIVGTGTGNSITNTRITISQTPFVTDNWENIPEEIPDNDDNFLFNNGTDNKKISTKNLTDKIVIPNIKIGSTNLISQSVFGNCPWIENYENGYYTINQQIAFSQTEAGGKDLFGLFEKYKQNTQYTLSGEAQCLTTGNKGLIIYVVYTDGTQDTVTTNGAFPSDLTPFSFTTAKEKTVSRFKASFYDTGGDKTKIKVKLEEGNIASAWSPAPEDFAPFVDYTNLEEQIVPGEFWTGVDNVKRQVYIRTFIGNIPNIDDVFSRYVYLSDFFCNEVEIVRGTVGLRTAKSSLMYGETALNSHRYWDIVILGTDEYVPGRILLDASCSFFKNAPYSITIKYTKM